MKGKIPLQTEIAAYMKERKGWPDEFCAHYADRFWNHYQAQGWKLSNGNAIKDWKACFNSQWQTFKYKEDLEKFNLITAKKPAIAAGKNDGSINIQYANEVFEEFRKHPTSIPRERLSGLYDWLKEQKLIKLSHDQIKIIRENYSTDMVKGKAISVETFFGNLMNSGLNLLQVGK